MNREKAKDKMSVKQYADWVGMSRQGILYRINKGLVLADVKIIEKVGKAYVLTIYQ